VTRRYARTGMSERGDQRFRSTPRQAHTRYWHMAAVVRSRPTAKLILAINVAALVLAGCTARMPHAGTRVVLDSVSTVTRAPARTKALTLGPWTDATVSVTGSSLGAVTRSMALATASRAAGTPIVAAGDGAYNSRVPGLEISLGSSRDGNCFRANTYNRGTPRVITPNGFVLGTSVSNLQRIYVARLHYSPGTVSTGGYYGAGTVLDAGWSVADNGGYLLFQTTNNDQSAPVTAVTSTPHLPPSKYCAPG
jgi:hypothetical protein